MYPTSLVESRLSTQRNAEVLFRLMPALVKLVSSIRYNLQLWIRDDPERLFLKDANKSPKSSFFTHPSLVPGGTSG